MVYPPTKGGGKENMIHPKLYQEPIHKYTINLPKSLYAKARSKSQAIGIYSVSIYFRSILIREIEKDLLPEEVLSGRKQSIVIDSAKHRRVLLDNIYKSQEYQWNVFSFKIKKFLDKVKSRQYTWW